MKTIRSLGLRFPNMNVGDAEEVVSVLDSCLASIKWRMRASAKRRLQIGHIFLQSPTPAIFPSEFWRWIWMKIGSFVIPMIFFHSIVLFNDWYGCSLFNLSCDF